MVYIILLRNKFLLFSKEKPNKKGNYQKDVRLFKLKGTSLSEDIIEWIQNDHENTSVVKEVVDWE